MNAEHKSLDEIRVDISSCACEAEVLFAQIYEMEINRKTILLSEIGIKICKELEKKCEDLEKFTEKINES